jgi:hypothetical protein
MPGIGGTATLSYFNTGTVHDQYHPGPVSCTGLRRLPFHFSCSIRHPLNHLKSLCPKGNRFFATLTHRKLTEGRRRRTLRREESLVHQRYYSALQWQVCSTSLTSIGQPLQIKRTLVKYFSLRFGFSFSQAVPSCLQKASRDKSRQIAYGGNVATGDNAGSGRFLAEQMISQRMIMCWSSAANRAERARLSSVQVAGPGPDRPREEDWDRGGDLARGRSGRTQRGDPEGKSRWNVDIATRKTGDLSTFF